MTGGGQTARKGGENDDEGRGMERGMSQEEETGNAKEGAGSSAEREAILDALGDGLVNLGLDGKVLDLNPALERMRSLERSEPVVESISLNAPRIGGEMVSS